MGHHQVGKNERLNTQLWMEIEISLFDIYIYIIYDRIEWLCFTVLRVSFRKVSKNDVKV
jgi:hypothetical protein